LDVINNAEETYKNWLYMKDKGLNPIPTFHTKEPLEFLEFYCKNCDYIALGGMVDHPDINKWLSNIWHFILSINSAIKVHGFGMTIPEIIYKYPWYSFDSSSFKSAKRFGRVPFFNSQKLIMLSIPEWAQLKALNNFLERPNKERNKLLDLAGAEAYYLNTEYYNQFSNKIADILSQTKLF
jgi:hypothetical protein